MFTWPLYRAAPILPGNAGSGYYGGMHEPNAPFITLGKHLRYVREQSHESLAEVSGAVEIDIEALERIEAGEERPAEDILLLLINHFNVQDQEAVQLWELAGYEGEAPEQLKQTIELPGQGKQVVVVMAQDSRAHYSDGIDVTANQAGLILNFTQATGIDQQATVARVGMSREQAAHVVRALQIALLRADHEGGPKRLPPTL